MSDTNTACPRCDGGPRTRVALSNGVGWVCPDCGHQGLDIGAEPRPDERRPGGAATGAVRPVGAPADRIK